MRNLLKILRYVSPYWKQAVTYFVFNILSVVFSLISFAFFIPVLDILFNKKVSNLSTPEPLDLNAIIHFDKEVLKDNFYYFTERMIVDNGPINALFYISVIIVILFFLKNFFRYFAKFFMAIIRNYVVKNLRRDIFDKILILPLSYYSSKRKGDIISRITTDVTEVEVSVMSSIEMILQNPITIIFYLGALFLLSPSLTLFVLVLLPISGYLIAFIGKSLKRTSAKSQAKMGEILAFIEESLGGLMIIKAFNGIGIANQNFEKVNQRYTQLVVRLFRKKELAGPISEFMGAIVLVIIVWFGGKLVLSEESTMNGSIFITYIAIFSQMIPPAKAITKAAYNIQKGSASIDRIEKVINEPEVIIEKTNAKSIKSFNHSIEFKNISFAYWNMDVISNLQLEISKGKTIALVGPSGAGKSTIINLLLRFYDCQQGQLLIDGIDIKEYKISDVRSQFGIVSQEAILFNDSIFNNICFGWEATEEQVIEAAKVANAHEFILETENGYETVIGDRGTRLSGGQKQRLSIARAILRNPPILLFDEATSALDTESEMLVQDALNKLLKGRTSIIIAHRLSTIQNADEIIVLKEGKIKERGTHEALISENGLYKKLIDMQSFK